MNAPGSITFNAQQASLCCQLSADVYRTDSIATPLVIRDAATDTLAAVFLRDTDVIVAFRGTADLRNWLTDIDCAKVQDPFGPGLIHAGFHDALHSIWHELFDRLRGDVTRGIVFTGHSLGGALAMLAAGWLADEAKHDESLPKVARVYTFGQPRVGNSAYRDGYNADLRDVTFRIVHADDIVPRVPWLLGSYRHAGREAFFPSAPSVPLLDLSWPRKLLADVPGLIREVYCDRLEFLDDHHINTYLRLFSANEPEQDAFAA